MSMSALTFSTQGSDPHPKRTVMSVQAALTEYQSLGGSEQQNFIPHLFLEAGIRGPAWWGLGEGRCVPTWLEAERMPALS